MPGSKAGPLDLSGTGAHLDNPWVVVKGAHPQHDSIRVAYQSPIYRFKPGVVPQFPSELKENEFAVLFNEPKDSPILRSVPALSVIVVLPQFSGLDSSQSVFQGMFVDGKLAWETQITVKASYFDQMGQFICVKHAQVLIKDLTNVDSKGRVQMNLLWPPHPVQGLRAFNGRTVGTGILLSKVEVTSVSTALVDMDIYSEDGTVDQSQSVKIGDKIRQKKTQLARLGYLR